METDATLNKLFAFNNVSVYLNKVYFVPFITAFGQIGRLMIDYQNILVEFSASLTTFYNNHLWFSFTFTFEQFSS